MAFKMRSGNTTSFKKMGSSPMKAGEDKLPSYEKAWDDLGVSGQDKYLGSAGGYAEGKAEFIKKAQDYNTKKYGTTSPSAEAKKKGATRAELAQRQKESPRMDVQPLSSREPVKNKKAEERTLKASTTSVAPSAPKPAAKGSGGTRTKVTAKDGSKVISRGGRVVKTVDAKGDKTRYNRKGEETQGSINRRNRKANKAAASAEKDASNARRLAERDASRASHDEKVAGKKSDKRAADKVSSDAKTQKYLSSNRKKRSDLRREASKLADASGGKLRKGQAKRSIKRDRKLMANLAAEDAANATKATKKANTKKAVDALEKDITAINSKG
jgi:hypothetical protein